MDFSKASGGAFDITVRPLTALWNFGHQENIPQITDIDFLLNISKTIGYKNIVLDEKNKTVFLKKVGCSIDLGGIAKGYAADEAKEILLKFGIENALINFGGNVFAIGKNPQGNNWKIGIQNPLSVRGKAFMSLTAENESVVTSAVNERFFIKDGKRYHHILDSRTGYPAQSGLISVTVTDTSSLKADALSTAAFVLGIENGSAFIKSMNSKAIFVTESGDIFSTYDTND